MYPVCAAPDSPPGVAYDAACNKSKLDAEAASKMHARVFYSLLYRHWTQYQGNRRQHLLLQGMDPTSPVRDLTPGYLNVPPFALDGLPGYVFTPDSTEITYVANTDPDLATSTNSDLFTVAAAGGRAKRITMNPGADEGPLYSPDGKYLAYRTQLRSGYESDLWRLAIMDLTSGQMNTMADSLDRWVEAYTWSSRFAAHLLHDRRPRHKSAANDSGWPAALIRTIAQGRLDCSVQFTPDDKAMIYIEQSGSKPAEITRRHQGRPGCATHAPQ